ncbi:hypothetical protein IFM89_002581, partial [Coptis chinensis]
MWEKAPPSERRDFSQDATWNLHRIFRFRFRESLKGEIGVFFPLIVLRSLDSSDGPLNQRASVL